MPDSLAELRRDLAVAYRMVGNEGILDAFGHISVRNPNNPDRYFLSRSRAPGLVQGDDILEYDLDSNPIVPPVTRPYSERVIHGEIFKARRDVNAVCHHHAPSIMPFAISGVPLVPVFHLGASMGATAPVWDSRDEFGDTELLITKPEEGRSMAKALADCWMVLLARHGATVVGHSLHECVFRSIYICRNAELQMRGMAMGKLGPLSKGEIEKCAAHSLTPRTMARAWEYWARRLEKADYATGGHSPKVKPEPDPKPQPAKLTSSQGEAGKKR